MSQADRLIYIYALLLRRVKYLETKRGPAAIFGREELQHILDMLIQPRSIVVREQVSSRMIDSIKRAVKSVAAKHNCSVSYVIATIMADAFGIKEQPKYYEHVKRDKVKSRKARRTTKASRNKQGKKSAA